MTLQPNLSSDSSEDSSSPAKGWVGQLDNSTFSLQESIGGWRGALESLLPGLVFVVAYIATRDLTWPLILSGGIAIAFIGVRLVQRSSLTQAFSGMIGVLIGVAWAALSGQATNYFAWGLVTNAVFCALMVVSLLIRKPAVLFLMQYGFGLPPDWRDESWGPLLLKRAALATWVWVGVFGIRLSAQLPLYLGGHVVSLGVVKLILGLPLFAVGAWITWVLLRGIVPAKVEEDA